MLTTPRTTRKPSPVLLFLFTFLLVLFFSLSWVSAKEAPKPKPQPWQIDGIMAALDESYPNVKALALYKLSQYELQDWKSMAGKKPEDVAKIAADILKNKNVDSSVRYSAAEALGNLGDAAKPYVKDILDFLKDKNVDSSVRYSAAQALGNLGDAAKPYVKDILDFLKDKNVDSSVRYSAAQALGNLGDAAKPYVKDIADFLKDKNVDSNVRYSAAEALGNLGDAAKPYVKDIADIFKDKTVESNVRYNAAQALGKIRKLEFNEVVIILNNVYYDGQSEIAQWRFLTYFLAGGNDEVKRLLKWLGKPDKKAIPDPLQHDQGKQTLELFLKIWVPSQGLNELRDDLEEKISVVASNKKVLWKPQDIGLLESHYKNLKAVNSTKTAAVKSVIDDLEFWKWFFLAKNIILTHLAIWLLLILAYPKSPQIQPIFWNPWLRRIGGFGYIGLLLTWVPFLRRQLFEPFTPILLADAGLDNFKEQTYFPESLVKVPVTSEIVAVTQALPDITGQIVLEGDSGLGKSMFLRHLVKTSQRTVAFLPAQKCDNGVISAISTKLQGQVQDAKFLRNLIYYGAIDICIDGLNEVTADTRAKVSQFVESYFRGNIIMTTQPLDWIPPSTAKKYELQPLEREQIQQFLISRQQNLTQRDHASLSLLRRGKDFSAAKSEGEVKSETPVDNKEFQDYEQACSRYIAAAFNDQQSPEDLAAAKRILSNPMDLTLVALMLSQGKQPDLFRLQEQQYQLMAVEYLRKWNHEFPLKNFSQAVYQMRLNDENAIPADEFRQELISMEDEKYKMVVSRQWEDAEGKPQKSWDFRHDKIMEFFLVQNFLGESEEVQERVNQHISEPRFRGVYLLLANLLPSDPVWKLRERLIEYAANTKDHTLSDTFVQLFNLRFPQQLTQDGAFKRLLEQQEQKKKYLDLVTQFLKPVDAKIKRENLQDLTIETIEGSLSLYTPLPVLLTVDTPTDKDVIRLVEISEKLANANLTPPAPLPYEAIHYPDLS